MLESWVRAFAIVACYCYYVLASAPATPVLDVKRNRLVKRSVNSRPQASPLLSLSSSAAQPAHITQLEDNAYERIFYAHV